MPEQLVTIASHDRYTALEAGGLPYGQVAGSVAVDAPPSALCLRRVAIPPGATVASAQFVRAYPLAYTVQAHAVLDADPVGSPAAWDVVALSLLPVLAGPERAAPPGGDDATVEQLAAGESMYQYIEWGTYLWLDIYNAAVNGTYRSEAEVASWNPDEEYSWWLSNLQTRVGAMLTECGAYALWPWGWGQWLPGDPTPGAPGGDVVSVEFSSVVQAVVDQPGWRAESNVLLVVTPDTGGPTYQESPAGPEQVRILWEVA